MIKLITFRQAADRVDRYGTIHAQIIKDGNTIFIVTETSSQRAVMVLPDEITQIWNA